MTPKARTGLLAGVVGVLALAVGADRMGWLGGRGDEGDAAGAGEGARAAYLEKAALAQRLEDLIAEAPQWEQAAGRAAQLRQEVAPRLVAGATVELAAGAFRERVLRAAADLRLQALSVTLVTSSGPSAGGTNAAPVRLLELRIAFDTAAVADIYALVDRLENLDDLATNVSRLEIAGPGRKQVPQTVTVNITLHGLALVGA